MKEEIRKKDIEKREYGEDIMIFDLRADNKGMIIVNQKTEVSELVGVRF